jgi:hypothetical protein
MEAVGSFDGAAGMERPLAGGGTSARADGLPNAVQTSAAAAHDARNTTRVPDQHPYEFCGQRHHAYTLVGMFKSQNTGALWQCHVMCIHGAPLLRFHNVAPG